MLLPLPVDRAFTYRVPETLRETLQPGHRVRVPFRGRALTGTIAGLLRAPPPFPVRDIQGTVDPEPLLDAKLLELGRWIANTYLCSWGEALDAMLPPGVRRPATGRAPLAVRLAVDPPSPLKREAQQRLVDVLRQASEPVPVRTLLASAHCSAAPLKTLIRRGIAETVAARPDVDLMEAPEAAGAQDVTLTSDQARALETIAAALGGAPPRGVLLHGITGSGKTEVYLRAIRRAVDTGRQAIVLVPEIALTPQTVARFRVRFPRIAVLHSFLSDGDRARQWRAARAGEVDVVIGARSAVFAPARRLGLIILDEEHEPAYKQESQPRYHARDVALRRAELEGAAAVLGSATPSLESLHAARTGRLRLARLPRRIGERPLPPVQIVDMAAERRDIKRYPLISRTLENAVKEAVARGEQAILFLNRRGYATVIRCRRCAYILRCARCDLALTFHKADHLVECHACGSRKPLPDLCPECAVGTLWHFGVGTEKIEEEVRRRLPEAAAVRMDSDRMKTRRDYREALGGLWTGATDVIVGTQMIAKGLDVPNVTVIGVVNADTAFYLPDFRAAERTYQLLTQVAGRAGRGPKGGRVIVQTLNPTHFAIACAAAYDLDGFADRELANRKELGYPPYTRLVRILIQGTREPAVRAAADKLKALLEPRLPPVLVHTLGPVPAPIYRIKGRYRMQFLLKAADLEPVRAAIREAFARVKGSRTLQVIADVDPVGMI
ncbi:MAG: primosomal protein N' [Planctomycetes bacterium]|nr:primosomal protein N' [Planctomycetota bacterium]